MARHTYHISNRWEHSTMYMLPRPGQAVLMRMQWYLRLHCYYPFWWKSHQSLLVLCFCFMTASFKNIQKNLNRWRRSYYFQHWGLMYTTACKLVFRSFLHSCTLCPVCSNWAKETTAKQERWLYFTALQSQLIILLKLVCCIFSLLFLMLMLVFLTFPANCHTSLCCCS